MNSRLFRLFSAAVFVFCMGALFEIVADEVPDDYKNMTNPITLSESDVQYWDRQYQAQCSRCHGETGKGDGEAADLEEGSVRPANFTDVAYMNSKTDGELFYQIEMGGEELSAMPEFGPDSGAGWDEMKIWSMVAFIRRFAK